MQNTLSLAELLVLSLVVFNNEKHSKVNTVYAAEDGNVFIEENRAKIHKVKYHTITRTEAKASEGKKPFIVDDLDQSLIAEKTKELQELELVKANYQKMKSLALFFQIETEDQKADTLIAALTEYKSKISE